jgi:CubicO group peptidase (beta-lactamase class C family)
MGQLAQDIDPAEAGFDAVRLARVDRMLDQYLDAGRLAGWQLLITRRGSVVRFAGSGRRHLEHGLPVENDTLWRIYSMTKPITSVAAMMLYEEGGFELTDPVSRFIPSFADARVYTGGSDLKPVTVPAQEPIRIWHLLTHTAGLTYGFHRSHPVDAMLRAQGYEWGAPPGVDLEAAVDQWAGLPLLFEPVSEWNYSYATDVLGLAGARRDAVAWDGVRARVRDPGGPGHLPHPGQRRGIPLGWGRQHIADPHPVAAADLPGARRLIRARRTTGGVDLTAFIPSATVEGTCETAPAPHPRPRGAIRARPDTQRYDRHQRPHHPTRDPRGLRPADRPRL